MVKDMFYSEYLAIQEKYDLKRREFLPPFTIMLTVAFSFHLVLLIVLALLPPADSGAVPFRPLHLKFGTADGTGKGTVHASAIAIPDASATPAPARVSPKTPVAAKPAPRQSAEKTITRVSAPPREAPAAKSPTTSRYNNLSPASGGYQSFASLGTAQGTMGSAALPKGSPYGSPSGTETGGEEVVRRYEQMLSAWIERHKIYPLEAQENGIEGNVLLRIRINRQGTIQYITVERGSGSPLLDSAVVQTARASNPVPVVPTDYPGGDYLEFRVPMQFQLVN